MTNQTIDPAATDKDHDAKGRFKVGNRGGPGNPFARQVANLRKALLNSITAEDIQAVAARLVDLAKDGDVAAAKLLFSYTIGKPDAAPQPDRMDVDEWEGYRETASMKTEAASLAETGVPAYHLDVVRTLRPIVTELMRAEAAQTVTDALAEPPDEPLDPAEEAELDAMHAESTQALVELLAKNASPSPNGTNGKHPPSANGQSKPSGEVLQTAGMTDAPSPNGRFHLDDAA